MGIMSSRFFHEALFGGVGRVDVNDLFGATHLPPFTAVLWCELAPGGRVGVHQQEHCPEVVVFIAGRGAVEVDGERADVGPGALVALPLGSTLAIENGANDAVLRYLIIKAAPPVGESPP